MGISTIGHCEQCDERLRIINGVNQYTDPTIQENMKKRRLCMERIAKNVAHTVQAFGQKQGAFLRELDTVYMQLKP